MHFSMHGPLAFQVSFYITTKTKNKTPVKFLLLLCIRFMTATKAKTHHTAHTHIVHALDSCRVNCYYLLKEVSNHNKCQFAKITLNVSVVSKSCWHAPTGLEAPHQPWRGWEQPQRARQPAWPYIAAH